MQEVKLVDLSDIALPDWLPNNYIQAVADAIESTGFTPPIVVLDDELLTPDIVAALLTVKARGKVVPVGVAVMDNRWLVKVNRRVSKVVTPPPRATELHLHYHDDWYRHVRPSIPWRENYWTYTGSGSVVSAAARVTWSADQPLLVSHTNGSASNG